MEESSSDQPETDKSSKRALLTQLNLVLVSILKQEWPHNWPNFINEIITSCHSSLSICENNMNILRLLSEEVFDFSQDQMTSSKARNLKTTMTSEFASIFQLCSEVLNTASQPSLVKATLKTLLRFLNWIPLGYIFETPIIETLNRYLAQPEFRNVTLKCLTEIGGLQIGPPYNYDEKVVHMFTETMTAVSQIIPLHEVDLKQTYDRSNEADQQFVTDLALFFSSFFSAHLDVRICSLTRSLLFSRGHLLTCVFSTSSLRNCRTKITSPTHTST